jgi:hypothetical protein
MVLSTSKPDHESELWQRMIELGLFDDAYPQRLNACFHYLSASEAPAPSSSTSSSSLSIDQSAANKGHENFSLKVSLTHFHS